MIPYGRQTIEDDDVQAVVAALRSDWLTTGPLVDSFERAFSDFVEAKYAVAIANGTAALHAAMYALGVGPGDEVVVPAMTFAASANCVVFQGAIPVFADICEDTLLVDPADVEAKITKRTKAIISVDYAGQPCDYASLQKIAASRGIPLVDDACHALGGVCRGRKVGSLADVNTFSLHPVKHITTGEGGMITTDDEVLANRMRTFRNHGITTDHRQRERQGSWFYEMTDLGYNYRLTDFQCALGMSQLNKLPGWVERRRAIARRYDEAFAGNPAIRPLAVRPEVSHAYHLYVVRLGKNVPGRDRGFVFKALREAGIGVNVHYIPVHLHPFYRSKYATHPGMCPRAEAAYERILSLPIYQSASDRDVATVIETILRIVAE